MRKSCCGIHARADVRSSLYLVSLWNMKNVLKMNVTGHICSGFFYFKKRDGILRNDLPSWHGTKYFSYVPFSDLSCFFKPLQEDGKVQDRPRPLPPTCVQFTLRRRTYINKKPFETTMEHATHMSKSCTVTLVAALTTSRCESSATGWRSDASGSRGVWMTSWWVLESASPSAAWVYFNSRSRRPPSATHKRRGNLTTLYHLQNIVSRSFSTHQFVCNTTINGDCTERKKSIK